MKTYYELKHLSHLDNVCVYISKLFDKTVLFVASRIIYIYIYIIYIHIYIIYIYYILYIIYIYIYYIYILYIYRCNVDV